MASLKSRMSAPAKAVDPTLDALFASSVGPVEPRAKPEYASLVEPKQRAAAAPKPVKPLTKEEEDAAAADDSDEEDDHDDEDDDDEDEDEENEDGGDNEDGEDEAPSPIDTKALASKKKRKTRHEDDDLESRYFDKLSRELDGPAEKRAKHDGAVNGEKKDDDENDNDDDDDDDASGAPLVHESLLQNGAADTPADAASTGLLQNADKDKANRTVFLSNVSILAVTDKAAKKTLLAHLSSVGQSDDKKTEDKKATEDKDGKEGAAGDAKPVRETPVVESLRFRSVPFSSAALPKRAAYITKAVMGATAQSTNAYAVYATAAAARRAVRELNGTVVLDRHLRADSVAHPAPVDHRRCVFVGNLGFVDDETVLSGGGADASNETGETDENGEPVAATAPTPRKRRKTPMDVEEGLWRAFGVHAGPVESVRVVRDAATRVGKGFAYVQFVDINAVEAALLLAGKTFPPRLPRPLRVSRCKAPHKTARALERVQIKGEADTARERRPRRESRESRDRRPPPGTKGSPATTGYRPKLTAEQQTQAGRAAKLLGKARSSGGAGGSNAPGVVFEGMRARAGSSNLFKKGKKGKAGGKGGPPGKDASRNQQRRAGRAASWRAKQGGAA